ncbi:MAG: DUF2782 domain-containing protein [Pseudomonadales bacterium]
MVTAFAFASNRLAQSLLTLLLCAAAAAASAASGDPEEGLRGPDITIIAEQDRTIQEFRQNGQLRMVRIQPKVGKPYYLVPRDQTRGYGDLERADMLLPSWVIMEF